MVNVAFEKSMKTVKYNLKVVIGTHPIPHKYFAIHSSIGTWETPELSGFIKPALTSEKLRIVYD